MAKNDHLPVSNSLEAFWSRDKDDFYNHRTTVDLPDHSDIVIIGAGYTGTATAWHLVKDRHASKPKQSITILEARQVCSGATGRNGGHLRPDLYGHIPTYIHRDGLEAAVELAEFEIAHVPVLKQLIEDDKIDCDLVLDRCIDVWSNQEAADKAKIKYEQMMDRKLDYMKDVTFQHGPDAEALSGVKGAKATGSYSAGSIWAYKFIAHLLKSLVRSGAINLQTNTPVTAVTPSEDGFIVKTPRGLVRAHKVVHANNAYVAGLLPEYSKSIIPCKGTCCRITVPEGKDPPKLTNSYIERNADKTLSYLIPRPDGSIVVGGASSIFYPFRDQWYNNIDDSVLVEAGKTYYDGYMQRTFSGWEDSEARVDQIWSGVMGYSYDSHAHIGAVPDRPGQFIIAGFNGHGMPVIWLGAKGVAKMINEGVPFEETGVPRLLKSTKERLRRAQEGKEEWGDILGDGSLDGKADTS